MRIWTLFAIIFLLSLSGCGAQLVDDGSGFLKTSSGQKVRWPDGKKVLFLSDSSVPDSVRDQIVIAEHELNSQFKNIELNVQVSRSAAPKIKKSKDDVIGDGVNGIYFLAEPWPWKDVKGKENSDAMTVLLNRGTEIKEADIFYRLSSYSEKLQKQPASLNPDPNQGVISFSIGTSYSPLDSNVGSDQKWTKVAFIHECLHAVGFTHVEERDSIMYPLVSLGLYQDPFSELDLERISTQY